MPRKALSKTTRFEVFKRDHFRCQYCGDHPPKVILHVDHINPVANGGSNHQDNLITSCENCNMGKGARLLQDIPESLKDKAQKIKEREEQIAGYNEIALKARDREDDDCWKVADIFSDHFSDETVLKTQFSSIRTFVQRLGVVEVMESMDKAVARQPRNRNACFSYFCGICWRKIKENPYG